LILFPAIFSVWISFRDVGLKNLNDVFQAPFVGLDNYRAVVKDFAFKWQGLQSWGAAVTSVVYSFAATILTMVVGLIASLLLNRPFRGRGLARAIFLFSYVAPIVSVARPIYPRAVSHYGWWSFLRHGAISRSLC